MSWCRRCYVDVDACTCGAARAHPLDDTQPISVPVPQPATSMRRVIIESPYAGNIVQNIAYLRAAMRDCLLRGEAPFASHGLYTQPGVLDDNVAKERACGIEAGFMWRDVADMTAVYIDLGVTAGMRAGIAHATKLGHHIDYRTLDRWRTS